LSFALFFTPIVLSIAILLFVVPVLARLFRQYHLEDVPPDWLANFSPESYRPMELLLAEEDFNFLLRQPGFDRALFKKLKKDRLRIFRQYLNRLIGDFNRLDLFARFLISRSQDDHSAVLGRLIWLRVRFSVTVLRVEASLVLVYLGYQPRVVSHAIKQLEEMNAHLKALAPA
jgi:hypothetical protein